MKSFVFVFAAFFGCSLHQTAAFDLSQDYYSSFLQPQQQFELTGAGAAASPSPAAAAAAAPAAAGSVFKEAVSMCRHLLSGGLLLSNFCSNKELQRKREEAGVHAGGQINKFNFYPVKMQQIEVSPSGPINIKIKEDLNTPAHAAEFLFGTLCRGPVIAACMRLEETVAPTAAQREAEAGAPSAEEIEELLQMIADRQSAATAAAEAAAQEVAQEAAAAPEAEAETPEAEAAPEAGEAAAAAPAAAARRQF